MLVGAFNEKALVGTFSVIAYLREPSFEALIHGHSPARAHGNMEPPTFLHVQFTIESYLELLNCANAGSGPGLSGDSSHF